MASKKEKDTLRRIQKWILDMNRTGNINPPNYLPQWNPERHVYVSFRGLELNYDQIVGSLRLLFPRYYRPNGPTPGNRISHCIVVNYPYNNKHMIFITEVETLILLEKGKQQIGQMQIIDKKN